MHQQMQECVRSSKSEYQSSTIHALNTNDISRRSSSTHRRDLATTMALADWPAPAGHVRKPHEPSESSARERRGAT